MMLFYLPMHLSSNLNALCPRGGFFHPQQEHMKDTYIIKARLFKFREYMFGMFDLSYILEPFIISSCVQFILHILIDKEHN